MVTYVATDATSIDSVATYSDSSLTTLVETLTSTSLGSGAYTLSKLTYALYTVGTRYWLKVVYTPATGGARTQSIPFYVFPANQASGLAADSGTDEDGFYIQTPYLGLRVGRGAFREADLSNAVYATRNRYEAVFPTPENRRGKLLYLSIFNYRAGEPFSLDAILVDADGAGKQKAGQA